ncbi:MAG: ABC transporter permease [Bacteroidales bacterium]|nr:ABC transporter permease [Bacteroidales bacterium]
MLKNFLKIAYRNLFKYKYYSIINILGFAIGISTFAIASIFSVEELSYDSFHNKAERIYRIANVYEKDSTLNKYATSPFPLGNALKNEYPQFIQNVVRIFNFQNNYHLVEYHDKHYNEKNFFYADPSILDIFDFDFILGNKANALAEPNTVIISESIKNKYFGKFNPLGKEILINEGFPMTVAGVFKDYPAESHVHFDIITSFSSLYYVIPEPKTWLWSPCWTYILLKENTNSNNLEKNFPEFVKKYFDEAVKENSTIFLQKLTDIHLKSDLESEIERNSKSLYIYILLTISLFLLFVSWLNFINLSIVGSITRIREVSIRKILGSSKRTIISQFFIEALLFSILSFLVAMFLLEILIPFFNYFTGRYIAISGLLRGGVLIKIFFIALLAGTIVGIYTGIYASSFPTFNLGRFKHKLASKKWFSGKILILIQYTISLVLLIAVFVNFKQLIYLKNSKLGFDEKNVLLIPVVNTPIAENYEAFKSVLIKNPEIKSVSAVNHIIGADRAYRRYFYIKDGMKKVQFFPELIVRHDFIKTLGIDLLAGSDFRKGSTENVESARNEIIINESLAKQLGFNNYHSALRKKLVSFKGDEHIVGVILNFNTRSLHNPVSPLVIRLSNNNSDATEDTKFLVIKFKNRISKKTIKFVNQLWKSYTPNRPMEINLLDKLLDKQYENEDLLNFFLWVFSILIIIISSMGVWAITSLLSIQRTKEIGIRKALGASIPEILRLFLKDFTSILIIANLVAWPVSWLILNQWFKNFAHHTVIEWQIYVYASLSILILTLGIVTKHALKVANSNTVNALRDE